MFKCDGERLCVCVCVCVCVCDGLVDVSISAITTLTDMIISEKLIWKDIKDSGVAQYFFLFQLEMLNRYDIYTMVGTIGDEGVEEYFQLKTIWSIDNLQFK